MGFSRQEYWSGLPFPSPGDLPNPGIEPGPPALQADAKLPLNHQNLDVVCFRSNDLDFPGDSHGKESACNAGDVGFIAGLGRSPGEGNGKPLQYSCLENPIDREAWWATVHRVVKSQTQVK